MNETQLEIDGKLQGFHEVWVHLQDVSHQKSVEYRISVAGPNIHQVFDPYSTKKSETSWVSFIQMMVDELGTFIVEGFIENILAIVGGSDKVYIWVIATVDEVKETEDGIDVTGRAVQFVPYG